MLRTKRGFTLIEITIAMAIAGLIMGALGSVFYYLMVVPPEQSDRLTATNELRFALDWIQHDGVQAQEFHPPNETGNCTDNCYGYFYADFYSDVCRDASGHRTVYYKYEQSEPPSPYGRLIREEIKMVCGEKDDPCTVCKTTTTDTTLSSHIVDFGNVSFAYEDGDDQVTVDMTVMLNPETPNEISETDTRYIEMRAAQ